jgi:signal transduction histidine kinase
MPRSKPTLWKPILFGVVAVVFTISVLVGWSVIFTQYYLLAHQTQSVQSLGLGYWVILSAGCFFLAVIIATLITFLVYHIRQALYVRQQITFLDSVTHELKSPLASLLLGLDTMELRAPSPERAARLREMMRKDINRLQNLIEHVLEASRLEHDERALLFEPVWLPELVHRCVERVEERYPQAHGKVHAQLALPSPLRPLIMDPVAMEMILLNLLDNAIKYSGEVLEVKLFVGVQEEDHLLVRVEDRGVGLEPRQRKKIFRRFHRVDSPETRRVRGTGLGLYVVHSLVKRLKGRIQAQSAGLGQGTTFTVRLPARWEVTESPETLEPTPIVRLTA